MQCFSYLQLVAQSVKDYFPYRSSSNVGNETPFLLFTSLITYSVFFRAVFTLLCITKTIILEHSKLEFSSFSFQKISANTLKLIARVHQENNDGFQISILLGILGPLNVIQRVYLKFFTLITTALLCVKRSLLSNFTKWEQMEH